MRHGRAEVGLGHGEQHRARGIRGNVRAVHVAREGPRRPVQAVAVLVRNGQRVAPLRDALLKDVLHRLFGVRPRRHRSHHRIAQHKLPSRFLRPTIRGQAQRKIHAGKIAGTVVNGRVRIVIVRRGARAPGNQRIARRRHHRNGVLAPFIHRVIQFVVRAGVHP